jgi:RHH-type rel operon transcriptional repressor/antitoxin RelB
MSQDQKLTTLSTRIPSALYNRIDVLAKETGRSKSYYVQKMLEEGIEDLELLHLAKMRSEEARSGKSRVYTWAEIKAQNDL